LRDEEPVSWQSEHEVLDWPSGPGHWALTRYADVGQVLRSPEVFSSWLGATQIRDPEPADLAFIRRMTLNMDPPERHRLRRSSPVYSPGGDSSASPTRSPSGRAN
jgi:cytochrome P450